MKTEKELKEEHLRESGFDDAIELRNAEVKQAIINEIKCFEKPETELNKAMVFYLKELFIQLIFLFFI